MPELPHDWHLRALKRLATIQTGITLGKAYDGPLIECPYLRVANVQDGWFDLAQVTMIEVPAQVSAATALRPGDVLMTEGGDLDKLGRGQVWRGEVADCLHQNHIFAVRCDLARMRPEFLAFATAASFGRAYFEATGKRTTNLAATNSTKVGLFRVPLPPLAEQDEIIAYLDARLADLSRLTDNIRAQITTLTAYRQSLVHECVTGQRRVTDADVRRAEAVRK